MPNGVNLLIVEEKPESASKLIPDVRKEEYLNKARISTKNTITNAKKIFLPTCSLNLTSMRLNTEKIIRYARNVIKKKPEINNANKTLAASRKKS